MSHCSFIQPATSQFPRQHVQLKLLSTSRCPLHVNHPHCKLHIMMASRGLPSKLHAVTLIRSGIGRPHWQKRTLEALGLTKLHKTIIHKNTPSVNGMLASVKELIKIEPVIFRTDITQSPVSGQEFFRNDGQFFVKERKWPQDVAKDQRRQKK